MILYAQPYNIEAEGFQFANIEEFYKKSQNWFDKFGIKVEEFEIQFIDGFQIDCELFNGLEVTQGNIHEFLNKVNKWSKYEKEKIIIARSEKMEFNLDDIDEIDIDIYEVDSFKELAMYFVDEGLFGEIPENIKNYIDYDAIGEDLRNDGYTQIFINGESLIYRCG